MLLLFGKFAKPLTVIYNPNSNSEWANTHLQKWLSLIPDYPFTNDLLIFKLQICEYVSSCAGWLECRSIVRKCKSIARECKTYREGTKNCLAHCKLLLIDIIVALTLSGRYKVLAYSRVCWTKLGSRSWSRSVVKKLSFGVYKLYQYVKDYNKEAASLPCPPWCTLYLQHSTAAVFEVLCTPDGVKLFIWESEKEKKGAHSKAEKVSESLLPTNPHVAQPPFQHHKQGSGAMSKMEGDGGMLCRERKLSTSTTATGTNLGHLNYSCSRWIRFPRISRENTAIQLPMHHSVYSMDGARNLDNDQFI